MSSPHHRKPTARHRPGAAGSSPTAARCCWPPPNGSSPNGASWRSGSRTSAPPPTSAAPRSTGTSPTRKPCWWSFWWRSAPGCWPAGGRSRPSAADAAAALDGLVEFHLDFTLGEPDLIRIQDRDLIQLPAAALRQVRRSQRQYVEIWVRVLRDLNAGLDESDARLMAHAAFGLLNSTPYSTKPAGGKPAGSRSRSVLRAMTVAALTSAAVRCKAS